MTQITLNSLANPKEVTVMATVRPGFCIVDFDGLYVFAELQSDADGQRWERWAGDPSPEDAAALRKVIEEHGGFDTTSVVVEPPAK